MCTVTHLQACVHAHNLKDSPITESSTPPIPTLVVVTLPSYVPYAARPTLPWVLSSPSAFGRGSGSSSRTWRRKSGRRRRNTPIIKAMGFAMPSFVLHVNYSNVPTTNLGASLRRFVCVCARFALSPLISHRSMLCGCAVSRPSQQGCEACIRESQTTDGGIVVAHTIRAAE